MALLSGELEKMLPSVITVTHGSGNGEFSYPGGITIGNDNLIYS